MKENTNKKNRNHLGIDLLKTFTERELNDFEQMISCRYFNKDIFIIRLLAVLRVTVLKGSIFSDDLRFSIYTKVFEGEEIKKKLNQKQINILNVKMTGLTRLAEKYLINEALKTNETYQTDLLYGQLLERKQYFLYGRHYNKINKSQERAAKKTAYYDMKKKVAQNHLNYLIQTGRLAKTDNLEKLQYYIDVHYLTEKMGYYITQLTLSGRYGKTININWLQAIEQLLALSAYARHPLLSIQRFTIYLIQSPTKKAYSQLLQIINQHEASIAKEELIGVYVVIANFSIRAIERGQFNYTDLYKLYETMDEKDCLLEGDNIPAAKLRSYVGVACRMKAFDRARHLIEKYKNFVRKPIRESMYHFNLGVVAFYEQAFDLALHHFIRVDINFDNNCRIMMLKSHYELDHEYDERTLRIYRSAERFFNDHQNLSRSRKTAHKNLIDTLINLYRIKHKATKMKLEKVKAKLEEQKLNSDKSWLFEKIAELEK